MSGTDTENPKISTPALTTSTRSLWFLITGMVALLAVGLIVALTVGRSRETTYPARSPERAVSTYLKLLADGRVDEAYGLTSLSAEPYSGKRMSREQFHQQFDGWSQRSHRVTLVRTTSSGHEASVDVEISSFSGDAFGPADQSSRQVFTLVLKRGRWRITGPLYLYL